ncbi:MAG: AtpZ/AtpI family protein [Myxococcales bacterium]|nr:MAG: AtpZ/AtpI family protein [Myxococcales bacterium]
MPQDEQSKLRRAMSFIVVGTEVSGAVAASALLGYWLDERLMTTPVFIIVLVVAATAGVFWRILRLLKRLEREDE